MNVSLKIKRITKLRDAETVTIDGEHAELAANIGTPDDLYGVMENGAEGIGLYRTEFLYMGEIECQLKMSNLKPIKSARNNERQTSCSSYIRYWWR